MANCTNCGYELDSSDTTACPRCGHAVAASPGAPPAFAEGRPDTTLFGLPAATDGDEVEEPNFGGPGGGAGPKETTSFGPPSLEPQPTEAQNFGEFDFGVGGGDSLQLDTGSGNPGAPGLDLPAPAPPRPPAPPRAPAPPPIAAAPPPRAPGLGGLDLPAPAAARPAAPPKAPPPPPGVAGLDLPSPVSTAPPPPKAPGVAGLDLPSPVSARQAPPKAPPGVSGLDLPSPAAARPSAPKAPPPAPGIPGLDLPTPVGLDLPAPVGAPTGGTPNLDSDLDLPQPTMGGAGDLPTPVGLDLPGVDRLNLPEPKSGLDVQPADNLVAPANLDLEPAGTGLTPAELGLESREAGGLAPREAGIAGTSPLHGDAAGRPGYAQPQGPTPRALSDEGRSRKMIYGVAALGLLAALGGGLYVAGVFDSEPESSGQRGIAKSDKPTPKDTDKPPTAASEAAERSADVFALLDRDTPDGYLAAADAAEKAGDAVGQAEALLLLHLRYGPALEAAQKGAKALEPHLKSEQPFVTRVAALMAIINKQYDQAATALAGDGPRLAAYRALSLLEQDKPAEAAAEAKQAGDLALGKAIALQAQLISDPSGGYAALKAAAAADPEHLGLAMLLAQTALDRGALRDAAAALAAVSAEGLPDGAKAKLAALQGRVATAQGDYPTAMARFTTALEVAPKDAAILEATVRAGIAGKQFAEATEAMTTLRGVSPESIDVLLLGVELSVAAGRGDEALSNLEALAKAAPDRVEVPFYRGEVQAMRLQLDEAKAEFDKVIEKDPIFHRVALAQAAMLNAARMPVEAVAALDAGIARLQEGKGDASAIAALLVAKARLQVEQKQTKAALAALDRALEVAPGDNDAQVLRGVTRMSQGDKDAGKADLEAVYGRTGAYPGLVAPLGRMFAASGELEKLEALLGDSAEAPDASAEVKLVAARLRLAQGKPDEAKQLASAAQAANPGDWEAQMLVAQAVLDAGDAQEALSRIEAVRSPQPIAEVSVLKGKILEYNGKHSDARVEYQRAVAIDPDNLEARFLHGRLLAYAGQAKQALGELQFVTAKTDAFPRAHLNIGRAHRDLGKNDEALAAFAKALELDGTLLEAHYLSGRLQLERNRLGAAVASLQAATADAAKDEPWYAEAWLFLGRARDKSGKRGAAKAAFEKFLEVAPPDHSSRATVKRTLEKL